MKLQKCIEKLMSVGVLNFYDIDCEILGDLIQWIVDCCPYDMLFDNENNSLVLIEGVDSDEI